jgi:hypothetical protein
VIDVRDELLTFLLSCACALFTLTARFGWQISREPPPEEPIALRAWKRRWLWTIVGELSTVPALGAGWTAAVVNWSLSAPVTVAGAMLCGALGFGFWLDAAQRIVTRKLDNV